MKSNEIRIGNWVYEHNDILLKIEADDIPYIHANSRLISPIPITPEVLEKCGFKKIYYTGLGLYEYHHPDLWNSLDSVGGGWNIEDNRCGWVLKQHIKYVHQLQNLFFALTGEELNINL